MSGTGTGAARDAPREIATIAELLEAGSYALHELAAVGEQVEDELQYVGDLVAVYEGRFRAVIAERGGEAVPVHQAAAAAAAIAEGALVEDPHRAIDWLSTLPQILLFTVGESA